MRELVHLIATSVYIAQGRLLSRLAELENHLGSLVPPVLLLSFSEKLHNLDFTFLFFFLLNHRDPNSPTRDQTWALGSERAES